ncbi:MAG: response regulator transcription factor [Chloroflexota bacterium]
MPTSKPVILVVDDDPHMLNIMKRTLEMEGYPVIAIDSGERALELLHQKRPGLVLLDIALPGIDGHETCRRIRKSSKVPVIMVSARDAPEEKSAAFAAGADGYITKPFGARELTARVKAVLRRTGSA